MAIKGLAAAMAARAKPKEAKEPDGDEAPMDGQSSGKLAACEDMISAFKRGDPKALMAALDDCGAMSSMPKDDEGLDDSDY